MSKNDTDTKPPADVRFLIQPESIKNVATGLLNGDISECITTDVKHTVDCLLHLLVSEDAAPGFIEEVFSLLPYFIRIRNRAVLGEVAQRKADEAGFGPEWREAVKAGKHPKQKDCIARMVEMYMKANGVNQATAIRALAEHKGNDGDNLRRSVTRSKSRSKT